MTGHGARGQHHQITGQPQDLLELVAHEQHRQPELVAQLLQVGQQLVAARQVDGGQGFIQQQQARLGQQGATDRHALPFATGQPRGASGQQRLQAQQGHDFREIDVAAAAAGAPFAVAQVAAHRQVREQPRVLEDVADTALLGRDIDAARGIEQHGVIDADHAAVRAQQARDHLQGRRLAATGAAEQCRDAGSRAVECNLRPEGAPLPGYVDFEHLSCRRDRVAGAGRARAPRRAPVPRARA